MRLRRVGDGGKKKDEGNQMKNVEIRERRIRTREHESGGVQPGRSLSCSLSGCTHRFGLSITRFRYSVFIHL